MTTAAVVNTVEQQPAEQLPTELLVPLVVSDTIPDVIQKRMQRFGSARPRSTGFCKLRLEQFSTRVLNRSRIYSPPFWCAGHPWRILYLNSMNAKNSISLYLDYHFTATDDDAGPSTRGCAAQFCLLFFCEPLFQQGDLVADNNDSDDAVVTVRGPADDSRIMAGCIKGGQHLFVPNDRDWGFERCFSKTSLLSGEYGERFVLDGSIVIGLAMQVYDRADIFTDESIDPLISRIDSNEERLVEVSKFLMDQPSTDGLKHLTRSLTHNVSVDTCNVVSAILFSGGAKMLSGVLQVHPRLTSLTLSANEIGDFGAVAIAESFKSPSCRLRVVNIVRNNVGPKGAEALADALKVNKTLFFLSLSKNSLLNPGAAILAVALRNNTTLRCLNLEDNGITDEGATALSKALEHHNRTLTSLLLYDNKITDESSRHLAAMLRQNNRLAVLDIGSTKISDIGLKTIAESLRWNQSLTTLYAGHNRLTMKCGDEVAGLLRRNCSLQSLWLNGRYSNKSNDVISLMERNHSVLKAAEIYCLLTSMGEKRLTFDTAQTHGGDDDAAAAEELRRLTALFGVFRRVPPEMQLEICRRIADGGSGNGILPSSALIEQVGRRLPGILSRIARTTPTTTTASPRATVTASASPRTSATPTGAGTRYHTRRSARLTHS